MDRNEVEIRVVAGSPSEVRRCLVFLQSQFPHSIVSAVRANESKPGYRGYLTAWVFKEGGA